MSSIGWPFCLAQHAAVSLRFLLNWNSHGSSKINANSNIEKETINSNQVDRRFIY